MVKRRRKGGRPYQWHPTLFFKKAASPEFPQPISACVTLSLGHPQLRKGSENHVCNFSSLCTGGKQGRKWEAGQPSNSGLPHPRRPSTYLSKWCGITGREQLTCLIIPSFTHSSSSVSQALCQSLCTHVFLISWQFLRVTHYSYFRIRNGISGRINDSPKVMQACKGQNPDSDSNLPPSLPLEALAFHSAALPPRTILADPVKTALDIFLPGGDEYKPASV